MQPSWLIVFILLFVILPAQRRRKRRRRNWNKEPRRSRMTNANVERFVGRNVLIQGDNVYERGIVMSVEDNWLCIEKKNGSEKLINLDYISQIETVPEKKNK